MLVESFSQQTIDSIPQVYNQVHPHIHVLQSSGRSQKAMHACVLLAIQVRIGLACKSAIPASR